jgi:ferrous iron transport protein A
MGFCPDVRVKVVSADRGSVIVSVGGARYALSRGAAMKVMVRGIEESA